jgi:GntR family transcriptional regulator/MocR family aminotransferase
MHPRAAAPTPFGRLLSGNAGQPLFRQLYESLRCAILEGQLGAGTQLPATRSLASDLGVSRNTVVGAYEQLLAEGYLEGIIGSGTYVARTLPEEALHAPRPHAAPVASYRTPPLSRRGGRLAEPRFAGQSNAIVAPFRPGTPALDAFPFEVWDRLVRRRARRNDPALLAYGDPAGYRPLREAIAAHVATARAVRCSAEQVLVIAGAQQAIGLIAQVLLDPGDTALVEDPGYGSAREALRAAGVRPVAIPVDGEGLIVDQTTRRLRGRLCYVTPSHQYPLGVTLSLARRLALLEWARAANAWILEDDYDSEFRYEGRPLASLQGLDPDGRVLYLGTFSKTLFPGLRLGYLIVPPQLSAAVIAARMALDQYAPGLLQAVVADFLTAGHYARHLRRMRTLYAQRQAVLVSAVRRECGGQLEVSPNPTGLHLVAWLAEGLSDADVSRRAAARGLDARPLSTYRVSPQGRGGIVLGFAAFEPRQIRQATRLLAAALDDKS